MTIAEVVERLNALDAVHQEASHEEADFLLCDALTLADLSEVADAYKAARRRVDFWYS